MSHRTASPSQQKAARAPQRDHARHTGAHGANQTAGRAGYTIAHAGRQIRFGPVAFWIAVGTVVIMAGWSITTGTYFAFHDDVVKTLIARQAAQQFAYEDRIADLRAQIDRTTSRQLLDQEQFEQKLSELAHRQATLESRAAALDGLTDRTITGSIRPPSRGGLAPTPTPAPLSDTLPTQEPPDRGKQSSIQSELRGVEASLDRVEGHEIAALDQMQARFEGRITRVRGVLDSLGVRHHVVPAATGGPFVPIKLPSENQGFARALTRVNIARAQADDLGNTLTFVPLRKPLPGELEMTSPFGVRVDPFLGRAEMHTGMDFRGNTGDPVHATAAGKVTIAGRDGGYGNMVEIDHGNGLATRYAHLSEIDVTVGQRVRVGEVVGRLGSTGRSTGPHLHYETRVNGEPVNPERFLAAGEKLFGGERIVRAGAREVQD